VVDVAGVGTAAA
jgi:hypothetical protein